MTARGRKPLDRWTTSDVFNLVLEAKDELGIVGDRLFGAKTMTKEARQDLGRQVHAARTKLTSALLKIENA